MMIMMMYVGVMTLSILAFNMGVTIGYYFL